ncbi:hypothetical protein NPIL_272721 [Nephila pilipes]|uniref:Uncharacterized protein n=1 Tax=Nephila pilipes TaxID=299642 RepID=A0A8X6USI5_NEPPI|nr:hypothetical protein NPIL_272721 [Nephila pilipes]
MTSSPTRHTGSPMMQKVLSTNYLFVCDHLSSLQRVSSFAVGDNDFSHRPPRLVRRAGNLSPYLTTIITVKSLCATFADSVGVNATVRSFSKGSNSGGPSFYAPGRRFSCGWVFS